MASLKDLIVNGSTNLIGESFADIIHANSFKTNGGTSSQFVKGDGSLDSSTYLTQQDISDKADKVTGATNGNLAGLDANGNLTDSGTKPSDFVNVQSDWNQTNTTADDYIKNKPNYASSNSFGGPANKAVSIPFGGIESTSTSTALTATVDGITELRDGVCCYLSNNQIDSENGWTLDINSLGAKPVYCTLEQNSRTQTAFSKGYTMLFVYNSTRVSGGCWDMYYGGNGNVPVLEQIYENYTCAAADTDNAYIYFMRVYPTSDNWYNPWYVHYTLEITTDRPECQGFYDIVVGSAGTTSQYCVFNKFYSTSYYPSYQHLMAWHNTAAKYAERETYPIRIGERIYSAYQAASRARTYKIKVRDYDGCRIEFPDNIETHISFYSADHYGYETGFVATSNGVLDNYDANTVPYQYYENYTNYKVHDSSTPLYRYKICGFDSDNKLVPLAITDRTSATQNVIFPTQVPMKVGNGMAYYSSTTTISTSTGRTASGTIYRGYTQGGTPFTYNFNGIPQNYCTIYACGSYDAVNGEFYLDTATNTSWYVCVPDTVNQDTDLSQYFTEGMYYWMIGVMGGTSNYGAVYLDHPVYLFDGKELVSTDNLYSIQTPSRWNNQIFNKRSTYGKNSTEATIDKIMGMSLSWNQLATEYTVTNGTATTDDGIVEVAPNSADCRYILRTVSGSNNTTPINTHLYLQTVMVKSDAPVAFINQNGGMVGNTPTFDFQVGDDFKRCYDIFIATSATASVLQMYSPTGDTFYVKEGSFMLFDLTIMFGKDHEPDAKKFFELFPREVYDYCEGELLDSYVGQETITTYDSGGNEIDSVVVGSNIALRSAALDYDEIYGTTKITRIGRVNLGDLTWTLHDSSRKIFKCTGFSTTYGADKIKGSGTYTSIMCDGGYYQRFLDNTVNNLLQKEFFLGSYSGDLYIRDTRYSNATDFGNSLDGVYMNFPLTTPLEMTITDIGEVSYGCGFDGTEEAENAYQGSIQSTPTCTPFRCCLSYNSTVIPNDANLVHKTGNETIAGLKQFTNAVTAVDAPFSLGTNNQAKHSVDVSLDNFYDDGGDGIGVLSFDDPGGSGDVILRCVNFPINGNDAANKDYVDSTIQDTIDDIDGNFTTVSAKVGGYTICQKSLVAYAAISNISSDATQSELMSFTQTGGTTSKNPITGAWFPIGCKIYYNPSEESGPSAQSSVPQKKLYLTHKSVDARYTAITGSNVSLGYGLNNTVYLMVMVEDGYWAPYCKEGETTEIIVSANQLIANNYYIFLGKTVGSAVANVQTFELEDNNPLYYYDGTNLIDYATWIASQNSQNTYTYKKFDIGHQVIGSGGSITFGLDSSSLNSLPNGTYKVTVQRHAYYSSSSSTSASVFHMTLRYGEMNGSWEGIAASTSIIPPAIRTQDAYYDPLGAITVVMIGFLTLTSQRKLLYLEQEGRTDLNLGGDVPYGGSYVESVTSNDFILLERIQ